MTTCANGPALLALLALGLLSCSRTDTGDVHLGAPSWSHDAVWYQVFVERFRNGDPSNDPAPADMDGARPDISSVDWHPTPWTQDWYRQEPWAEELGRGFYYAAQARRYGGDLQGVLDKLDYLEDLGVTALYFNPVNDAPSLHKFDARNYRHIDRNFGPDPAGDAAIMASENPLDPETWQWTAADSLFLELVRELHARGMRIILDYSWNHTGVRFWAWQDLVENQADSRFAEWYDIVSLDDPATADTNEFFYHGWSGVKQLPELAKVGRDTTRGAHEGDMHPEVKAHILNVTRRWLDPDGDGDPSDGIDGFRLDVAEMVPLGFWRDYRRFVRSINPEAYLVGEVWWESWPDHMQDPAAWLQGDVFDAVMNYRWYMPTRSFFAEAPPHLAASEYVAHLDSVSRGVPEQFQKAMMNLAASHDTPRISTSIYNPVPYKYGVNPRQNPEYKLERPDARTRSIQHMILVQQFTYPGAPHIWNGDELGMWGADDPDTRKPLVWPDLAYEDETAHPMGLARRRDAVSPDTALLEVYRQLIAMRRQHARLFADGSLDYLSVDNGARVLAYERALGDRRAVVAFNASDAERSLAVDLDGYENAFPGTVTAGEGGLTLAPRTAQVWIRR